MPAQTMFPPRLLAATFSALALLAAPAGLRAQAAAPAGPPPTSTLYKNAALPIEARVEDLLTQLTLEEKISLLHGNSTFSIAGLPRFGFPEHWTSDGPHGVREEIDRNSFGSARRTDDASTAFPAGIAVAATWNPAVARAVGEAIGEEGRARGKDIMLGPAVNIQRTPLNGRTFEYYGEDPWLSGRIAVGYIQGVQSRGVGTSVKHFAANNQETQRGSINVLMDERTLREIYLPAFEAAIKEGHALTLMASYNRFRGVYAAENDYLLNQVLKKEWGFTGLVMTDWGASHTTPGSVLGGLDLEMGTRVGNVDYDAVFHLAAPFRAGILSGEYPVALLDDKVRRNLRVFLSLDVLHPELRPAGSINTPAHLAVERHAAEEAMVLLKNTAAALPLDATKIKTIAVIGDNATRLQASGGQSSGIKAFHETSPLDGLKQYLGDKVSITFAQGYSSGGGRGAGAGARGARRGGAAGAPAAAPTAAATPTPPTAADGNTAPITVAAAAAGSASSPLLDAAVAAAKAADVAIVFAGLNKQFDTEGSDRRDMKLPYGQDELIARVVAANPRTIVVLVAGSPVEMGPWLEQAPAVLLSWYGGSEAGNAVARVLFGDVNPSGKLPCTFPKQLTDIAAHALGAYPGANGVEEYKEGLLVGYRWFDAKNIEPLFPFGHGLSYTTFAYSNLRVTPGGPGGATATAQFDVTNTGIREGAEVAQLYIHQNAPALERPMKELKGFSKISLKPGERQTVTIPLGQRAFAYYDPEKKGWLAEAGGYELQVGSSSRDLRLKGAFSLAQTTLAK